MRPRARRGRDRRFFTFIAFTAIGASCGLPAAGCDGDAAGQPVLRVANWGGPANDPAFIRLEREIREGFERQAGVRVQIENIPGEGRYVPKLLMMFVSGNAPDVIHLDASSAAVFIDNELLLDLTPLSAADATFDPDRYFPKVVDIARRGTRLFAIPLDFTPLVMYYNKRLFDEAGIAYPTDGWTWAEFLAKAKALTRSDEHRRLPMQYGFNFTNWMPGWIPWIWLNGGDVLSADGRRALGAFDSPETTEAIEFLIGLIRTHRVAPSLSESAAAGVDFFRQGRAAMTVSGHWTMIDYRADGLDFGVAALPSNVGRPATVIYESGLAINRRTRQRDLAWEYITYMTSDAVQFKRVASGLAISANKHVARRYAGDEIEQAFLDAVASARGPWGARVESYAVVEDLGHEMIDDILFGTPIPEAVHRTARLIESQLK